MTVRDIFTLYGPSYLDTFAERIPAPHRKVMRAVIYCRTPHLGAIVCQCEGCGKTYEIYRSCGNRHCPTCQGDKAKEWLASAELFVKLAEELATPPAEDADGNPLLPSKESLILKRMREYPIAETWPRWTRSASTQAKNSLVPIMTRIIFSLPFLIIGGSLIIETYFGIPGIGSVIYSAIITGDLPILKASVSFTAILYVIILSIIDVLYKTIDPRITLK